MLQKYIIEREIAGVGNQPPENYCGIAQTSKNVLADLAPRVQWLETFVATDKVYCVFLAEGPELIREHAERTGFPANKIEVVRGMIDPTYAPA
jgi:hypothetical protein